MAKTSRIKIPFSAGYIKSRVLGIIRKLPQVNIKIQGLHTNPFPKDKSKMLSWYEYKRRKLHIAPDGLIQGGLPRIITSIFDFTFVRSLVADLYSKDGAPCYDPVSLILLELFRLLEGLPSRKVLIDRLKDKDGGRAYRTYAGISLDRIPSEVDLHNFRERLGEERFNAIFDILVTMVHELGLITGGLISTDGLKVPTYSRFLGCAHACEFEDCHCVSSSGIAGLIKAKLDVAVGTLNESRPYVDVIISVQCPVEAVVDRIKENTPKGESAKVPCPQVLRFRVYRCQERDKGDVEKLEAMINTKLNLDMNVGIRLLSSHILRTDEDGRTYFDCPKIPSDEEARVGYKSSPNPDGKEKAVPVFGYNIMISVTVNEFGLIIPVGVSVYPGSIDEGNEFIPHRERIRAKHGFETEYEVADGKYDYKKNYEYVREHGAKPCFGYNKRGEDQSEEALKERGYDENGWPYGPCGRVCEPRGYDSERCRLQFSCNRKCIKEGYEEEGKQCLYAYKPHGYITTREVEKDSRLLLEVPRGTERFKKLMGYRSASESCNSLLEDGFDLRRPRVRGLKAIGVAANLSLIAMVCYQVARFIMENVEKVWGLLRDELRSTDGFEVVEVSGEEMEPGKTQDDAA